MPSLQELSRHVTVRAAAEHDFVSSWIERFAPQEGACRYHEQLRTWAAERQAADQHFTIVLYGRTMSGKSTLAEALTGGDGSTVGSGQQRTTRSALLHDANHLRLVDTPGIGAYGGEPDLRAARAQIADADLVIFLLTDDGLPATVLAEMAHIRDTGTPALFVLNVKDDLEPPTDRALWVADADRCFDERAVEELRADIVEQARQTLNIPRPQVLHLHALATLEVARGNQELEGAGRLQALTQLIELETRDHAAARRSRAILDGAAHQLSRVAADVARHTTGNNGELRATQQAYAQLTAGLRACAEELPASVATQVDATFATLHRGLGRWLERHIDDAPEAFEAAWQRRVDELDLNGQIDRIAETALARVQEVFDEVHAELDDDLRDLGELGLGQHVNPFDGSKNWHLIAKGGKWALNGIVLIPVIGLKVRLAISAVALVLGWAQKKNPHTMTRRQRHIAAARDAIKDLLDEHVATISRQISDVLVSTTGYRDRPPHWDASTVAGARVLELLARLEELRAERDRLDQLTDLLTTARQAVDTHLLQRLATTLPDGGANLTLVDRRRGERTLIRGELDAAALQHLSDLLDETVELADSEPASPSSPVRGAP